MTDFFFYHLERLRPIAFFPSVLAKSLEQGWRAGVLCRDIGFLTKLDQHLWAFEPNSFLPHGLASDPHEDHPIVLGCVDDETGDALFKHPLDVVFLMDCEPNVLEHDFSSLSRVCVVFEGHNADSLRRARESWKQLKEREIAPLYWKQNSAGRWEKQDF